MSTSLQILLLTPVITGFIGLVTNRAAVQMIFHPRRFVGIGRIGWLGVVPVRNDQFAREVADSIGQVLSARTHRVSRSLRDEDRPLRSSR